MTRQEFIKICSLLGIGIPFQSMLKSCSKEPSGSMNDKVIIVGAGAGGLTAGYLLNQRGIDFEILEASSVYGGRMKRTLDFVDFPIPLGGEWLHVERGVMDEAINDPNIQVNIETKGYDHENDYGLFQGMRISTEDIGFSIDQKFVNSSWFDFFEEYITPSVRDKIRLNTTVSSIDYSGSQINIVTSNGTLSADRVMFNAPVKILQEGAISFIPELPQSKKDALSDLKVWDGFKAFFEFSEKFYPTFIGYDIQPARDGQKMFYDASYGQNSDRNVLGLFSVGTGTLPYRNLSSDQLKMHILNELDEIFDGRASETYVQHISQNWNEEPFIKGAYITDQENWRKVRELGKSIDNKVFFAGCSYTDGSDWSSVHAAIRSAVSAVSEIYG